MQQLKVQKEKVSFTLVTPTQHKQEKEQRKRKSRLKRSCSPSPDEKEPYLKKTVPWRSPKPQIEEFNTRGYFKSTELHPTDIVSISVGLYSTRLLAAAQEQPHNPAEVIQRRARVAELLAFPNELDPLQ